MMFVRESLRSNQIDDFYIVSERDLTHLSQSSFVDLLVVRWIERQHVERICRFQLILDLRPLPPHTQQIAAIRQTANTQSTCSRVFCLSHSSSDLIDIAEKNIENLATTQRSNIYDTVLIWHQCASPHWIQYLKNSHLIITAQLCVKFLFSIITTMSF